MKIIMLGPPGVGKGTIARMMVERYRVPQISTGDLLRAAVKEGTELGRKAKGYMDSGDLVPDDIVINMIKERIAEDDCSEGYILDGFPRTIPQAEALEKEGIEIEKVLNLRADDSTIVPRLSARRVCRECGAIFNILYMKPEKEGICDKCGNELYQRDDDREEAIRNRLEVYRKQTAPLISFYEEKGKLVNVDVNSNDPDVNFQNTVRAYES
jgi:adenylate kinase